MKYNKIMMIIIMLIFMSSTVSAIYNFNVIQDTPTEIVGGEYINLKYSFNIYEGETNNISVFSSFITPPDLLFDNNTPEILLYEISIDDINSDNCIIENTSQTYILICSQPMTPGFHNVDVILLLSPALVPGNYQVGFGAISDYVYPAPVKIARSMGGSNHKILNTTTYLNSTDVNLTVIDVINSTINSTINYNTTDLNDNTSGNSTICDDGSCAIDAVFGTVTGFEFNDGNNHSFINTIRDIVAILIIILILYFYTKPSKGVNK